MLPAVEAMGGEIVECVVLVDRSGGRSTLTSPATGRTYPLRSLWQLDLPTYEPGPATCPRCADGTPLHAPGSSGTGTARTDRRQPADRPTGWIGGRGTSLRSPSVLIVASDGRSGAAARRNGRPRPGSAAGERQSLVGVIVGVGREGPRPTSAASRFGPSDGASTAFDIGALENGAEFPPGHLVEHQSTAQPIRVWYRTEDGRKVAIRLEDAT